MTIMEDRHPLESTTVVSQLPIAKWFDLIGNGLIADGVFNRIVYSSHRFWVKRRELG